MDGYRKAHKKSILEAWAQEGLIETAVEEMIIHVNGDDSDSETIRWRAPSHVLFSVFGEKVTAHGSARTNVATPRHQSPHCSLPLHTLPIRKNMYRVMQWKVLQPAT
ncbi:hypothetical protein J6590_026950 [Homalodisca vitripennis]|nr:hypothetical protein J6590_026950 [Homalodisca vitripennis]